MRKAFCLFICLMLAAAPYTVRGTEETEIEALRRIAQAQYIALTKQADAMMKEELTVTEPPSAAVSCADEAKKKAEGQSLTAFLDSFRAPEGPLLAGMLDINRQLQQMGTHPGYAKETALADRLGRKAQSLIRDYGYDITKVQAVSAAALRAAKDIQLLGPDEAGRADALMASVSAMYAQAVEELLRLLVQEHDYGTVQPVLDFARSSLLLSGTAGVSADEILGRLQNALRFELEIVFLTDLPYDHWEEKATLQLAPLSLENLISLQGTGTGSMTNYTNDDVPEAYFVAPAFPVQAFLTDFLPCEGKVTLKLSSFYPPTATANLPDDELETLTWDWPIMRQGWEMAHDDKRREGLYVFPLTLRNLDAVPVDESIRIQPTATLDTTLEITVTHKPAK